MTKTGVQRVTRFVSSLDGSEHETFAAAQKHNSKAVLQSWVANWLRVNGVACHDIISRDLAADLKANWNITKRKELK